ncbi:3-oxoacyl-ACP reductase family protein [Sulfolobus tengchongensis]|uniref:3-oxoacyl-ACP reductase family protein n=1 Tax=Sulfolobus tengchongensis TaxID=207809 RepID=A0AAX4L2N1_9CREN
MRLKDKVAIITGAAGDIGKTFSIALAKEGSNVVLVDIDFNTINETARSIESIGVKAIPLKVDVSDENQVNDMAKRIFDEFGRIDILVNNAAIYGMLDRKKYFYEISVQEFERVLRVNVMGVWLCSKAVFPYMKKQGKGKIINIASATVYSGTTGFAHYVASKAAVIGLTRVLAREMGEYNINVNAIAPGLTVTKATLKLNQPTYLESRKETRSIKRDQTPEDLVGTLIFLASDDSDFITGQTIVVDGGSVFL